MDSFDDENYNDGFDEEALAAQLNLHLWRKLFTYVRNYPRYLTWLAVFAFLTACMDVSYPLITKGVIDAVQADGMSAVLWPYMVAYMIATLTITFAIGCSLAQTLTPVQAPFDGGHTPSGARRP